MEEQTNNLTNFYSYPFHVQKAVQEIKKQLNKVDLLIEVCDARIPFNSRVLPLFKELQKDYLIIFNKADLSESSWNEKWQEYYLKNKQHSIFLSLNDNNAMKNLMPLLKKYQNKLKEYFSKKFINIPPMRILVLGLPNTGKSTLINRLIGKNKTKTGAIPGITRHSSWVKFQHKMEILDNPGILPRKLKTEDEIYKLYATCALKENKELDSLSLKYLFNECEGLRELIVNYYKLNQTITVKWEEIISEIMTIKKIANNQLSNLYQLILNDLRRGKIGKITFDKTIPD